VLVQSLKDAATAGDIATGLEAAVRKGDVQPGDRLPPIRALAAELAVSPMTVASAYRELRRRGLISTAGRRGTHVSMRPPLPVRSGLVVPDGARDVASGNPDPELLPRLDVALGRIDTDAHAYLEEGKLPELVELARAQLAADRIPAPAIAVVGGALDGIERVLAAHLRPGDTVAVEDPGFVRAYDLLRPLGLDLEPVRLDDLGPRPDDLERALGRGVQAVVLTPRAQNPTGAALDPARAMNLRWILAAHEDVLVIEDDHAAGVAGRPALSTVTADRPNWAIVRSVSKALQPDLRLAILAGDATTIARVEGRQQIGTGWVSRILQRIVAAFWSDPEIIAGLDRTERTYTERRDAAIRALAEYGITARGRSGLNVYVPVADEAAAVAGLLERGWAVMGCERWRLESGPAIRVTTAALPVDDAEPFAADLAAALATPSGRYTA
jgi:DNA-binding transcriptional MocR family regulator